MNREMLQITNKILKNREHIEQVSQSYSEPVMISHSEVIHQERVFNVTTGMVLKPGLRSKEEEIEFTTNVGEAPNTQFGNAVIDRLNHKFKGKFVKFDKENSERLGIVYATRKPAEWLLKGDRLDQELETHGDTTAIVNPLLEEVCRHNEDTSRLTNQQIRELGYGFVDNKIGLQHFSKSPPPQHLNKSISR